MTYRAPKRTGIMLCYPLEEKRLLKWKPPFIVQPKYNGERCRAVPVANGYLLLTSEENVFFSVPHINEVLNKELRYTDLEFDGELYNHDLYFDGPEGIHSIVSRTKNLHQNYKCMQYHIFDIVTDEPQAQRLKRLHRILCNSSALEPTILPVPFRIAETLEDVMRYYDTIIGNNYEGIIVRNFDAPYVRKRSINIMKFKPRKTDTYDIVGYKEEVSIDGFPKGRLGAIIASDGVGTFSVGSGLNDDLRNRLWEERSTLVGRKVVVGYQNISLKGKPIFSVVLEVV